MSVAAALASCSSSTPLGDDGSVGGDADVGGNLAATDGGATCQNGAACGGDVVGTWKATSACVSAYVAPVMGAIDCPGVTIETANLALTGSITFNADLTFSSDLTSSEADVVTLPASCFTQGKTPTWAQLDAMLGQGTAAGESGHCAADGAGNCTCMATEASQETKETGTYATTSAGVITLSRANGTSEQDDYCIRGTTLAVSPHADSSSTMGTGTSATLTLTKQ